MRLNWASCTTFLWKIVFYWTLARAATVPHKNLEGSKAPYEVGAVPSGPRAEPFAGPTRSDRESMGVWDPTSQPNKKRCGPEYGSCDPGYCCSIVGYCGKGFDYCSGPGCQLNYCDSCDGLMKPAGEDTINVPRPLIGNVTYEAVGVSDCTAMDTVALTFDDGPYNFTWHLLDVLASYNAKATFFVTGNNLGKGQIDIEETGWPEVLRRIHRDGHQIASHSWSHPNMTTLTEQQLIDQMQYNEMALRNVLGFFPTYMRPPYIACKEKCPGVMKQLGYHITYYSVSTDDYKYDNPNLIQASKDIFIRNMNRSWVKPTDVQYITVEHDVHYQTAYNLTNYMLDYLKFLNYRRSVTVGECLGDPPENWYRKASGAPDPSALLKLPDNSAATNFYIYSIVCHLGLIVVVTTLLV